MAWFKSAKIKLRKDTLAKWIDNDPVLLNGEIAITSGPKASFKIGEEAKRWSDVDQYQTFLSGRELKDYTDLAIETKRKNDEIIIHPYSVIADENADFTCTSNINNGNELQAFIDTLESKVTIRFSKGVYKLVDSSVDIGDRKAIFDFGSSVEASGAADTNYFVVDQGEIINGTFVFSGVSTQNQIAISSTNSTIRDCKFDGFATSIYGSGTFDNNYFKSNIAFRIAVTNSQVTNNYFETTATSTIECISKNIIINNYIGQVRLSASTSSVSAGNVAVLATFGATDNKVSDTVIG